MGLSLAREGMEDWGFLIQIVGSHWAVPYPLGLEMLGSEWDQAISSPQWLLFPVCVYEIHIILRLYQERAFPLWLIYKVIFTLLLHVSTLSSDPPGVPEACSWDSQSHKAGQTCWLCHSKLVHVASLPFVPRIWLSLEVVKVESSFSERKCFLLWVVCFKNSECSGVMC